MATETVTGRPSAAGTALRRDVGFVGLFMSSMGSIIGSGWLFGALGAAAIAGPAALFAWIIAGVAVIILALVHAELGAMYPVAGGTARFPHYAFGSIAGASFGFFSWLQAVTVAPIEVLAVEGYASTWWPALVNASGPKAGLITPLGYLVAVVLMAIFTAINFLGVKWLAHTNSAVTWWKIAIPLLAVIVLFTKFHSGNFSLGAPGPVVAGAHVNGSGGFMPFGIKGVLSAISSGGVMFAYLGFEQADQLAGEARNPQRNLPRAIGGSVLVGVLLYVLLEVVFIGALPTDVLKWGVPGIAELANQHSALGSIAASIHNAPFAGLSTVVLLSWLAFILKLDAVVSPGGTGLIYVTSTSRISYGLAKNSYYPSIFARTDKRGVPWFGMILAFALGLLFFLPFPSWYALVGLVTSASVLMYAGAPLALGAFRRQVPEANRPYRMPVGGVLSPVAFVIASLIVYWAGWTTLWKLGIAIVLGYVVILLSMADNPKAPKLEWRSAMWLPVYLIGMGLISWQGDFGGSGGITNLIGQHYWDMALVVLLSVGIYYWAMATRLPREKMLEYVSAQALPEADAGAAEPAAG